MAGSRQSDRRREVDAARLELGRLIQAYERDFGTSSYLNRAPVPRADALTDAVLLPERLALLDRLPKGGRCAEIGVDRGDFSREILSRARPSELFLVDLDLRRLSPENEARLRARPEARLIEAPSATALSDQPDGSFDWIYLDADHGYASVEADIAALSPKISRGGYFVFNDFTLWSAANCGNYGVSKAVVEFLNADRRWRVSHFALQGGGYHDIALQRVG
ncbi:hypothetical protein HKCCE2091_14895 [Rhodobacterales bacterium HKCCE2091]|nr:hypothetical protein [Rhodobacterales bacterium HKCCE2091]